ncbi:hypothetical protein Y032_0007g3293 [Ancylostoma ceylanicum]|uniref:Peptidase A2 domain-containing protein n=1 Tax=Ancylostoma ceylanicum TaxID=53326 RepID=A0A016VMF9_9BILA|nr:hypothetical protein Y032_0007g3293 [Ancylostoma ceylanicum]
MDANTLRAILDAQTMQQQKAFDAQAMQQQRTLNAVMERMERLFSAMGATPAAAPASTAEFVTNSLSTRLPEFTYDPDNGCTFDVWYNRYEDIIANDGSTLDDAAKARLIVSKLDAATYARFTNHILPKKTVNVFLGETVKTLKDLFGHNTSVFARRYAYLRTQRNDETIRDYTGLVNRRHEMAEFNDVTPEQMKCLVWICGLANPEDADIRAGALRKMEDNPQTTLKELSAEIQQFMDIRQGANLLGNQPSSPLSGVCLNAVNAKKNQSRDPLSPCFRCGGLHWAKDCDFANKTCHDCKRVGHKKGYCKNFTKKKKSIPKQKRRSANNAVTVASTTAHVTPVSRIYRKVQINGITVQMRLDTGADVTLLSHKDWIAIGRPKLLPPLVSLKSANNNDISNFNIDGHEGRGNCHVADITSLLGFDWIAQDEPLFRRLTDGAICDVSASTLNTLRASLTRQLQKQFATVFAPGLGRCVKSKAHLTLKPDAKPVFRKARPVPMLLYLASHRRSIDWWLLNRVLTESNNIRVIIRIFEYSIIRNIRIFEKTKYSKYSNIRIFGMGEIFGYSNNSNIRSLLIIRLFEYSNIRSPLIIRLFEYSRLRRSNIRII